MLTNESTSQIGKRFQWLSLNNEQSHGVNRPKSGLFEEGDKGRKKFKKKHH